MKQGPGLAGIFLRPRPSDTVDASGSGTGSNGSLDFATLTLQGVDGANLLTILVEDLSRIALFSDKQLEAVSQLQAIPPELPPDFARRLVEVCDQRLIERKECREALATVSLLKRMTRASIDEVDRQGRSSIVERSTQTDELRIPTIEGPREDKRRRTEQGTSDN
ncbi:hypothetical protein BIW11_11488 [Tropilaelaps mercedesae]|uniref:Uncharacterized protein n=1 Tax=Tropilaelaps mercedesae TaxID=418985 RepID=A0A1V9XAT0_9ACAR|nr:hypothetical protein BIW11_11488 [Tropilaelaps mercedesae]